MSEGFKREGVLEEQNRRLKEQTGSISEGQKSEVLQQIQEKLKGLHEQGYEESINFISTLGLEEQQNILLISSDKTKFQKLKDYIEDNGYPNKETYENFKKEFSLSQTTEKDKIATETKIKDVETKVAQNIEKLKILSTKLNTHKTELSQNGVSGDFLLSLEKASNGDQGEYEKVKKEILADNGLLEKILKTFKQIDEQNKADGKPSNLYAEMKGSFLSFDPSLRTRIEKFETYEKVNFSQIPQSLPRAQVAATLGTESPRQTGSILSNGGVNIDLSKTPPTASMDSKNGYKIPLDMPVREFYPATVRFEKSRQAIEPKLHIVDGVAPSIEKATRDLQGVESDQDKQAVTSSLKNDLRGKLGPLYDEWKIGEKRDINEIIKTINEQRKLLVEQLEQAKNTYHNELRTIAKNYGESQARQKEILKNRLDFLSYTGFDVIPQSITDQLVTDINSGKYNYIKQHLGITGEIDIKNGKFGVDNDTDLGSISDKERFIIRGIVNIVVVGNADGPVKAGMPTNPADLREAFGAGNLWNPERIKSNLTKANTPKETKKESL